ncbi:MAG: hypothetical protein KIT32_12285 [Rhodocyclaceae bacterium]|nr:hypothetical protein [Rhodocyclaceae bacterium]
MQAQGLQDFAVPASPVSFPPGTHFGIRNNNPMNIMALPGTDKAYQGISGTYTTRPGMDYLKFDSPEAGLGAAAQTIRYHYSRGADTLTKLFNTIAPNVPGHGNNPSAYAMNAAKVLGVNPDDKLNLADPAVMTKLLPFIVQTETGTNFAGYTPEMYAAAANRGYSGTTSGPPKTPPMMGMPGSLPPGVNPPGAMGMGDEVAGPGAVSAMNAPAAKPAAAPSGTPYDWGPNNQLWGMLASMGAGMLKPSYYGFGGQLGEGLSAGANFAQQAPMRRLQMEMLQANVGKAKQETAQREAWQNFIKALPNDHPLKSVGAFVGPEKVMDKVFSKPGEGMDFDMASGKWRVNPEWLAGAMEKAKAGATTVGIKMEAEATANDNLLKQYRAAAAAATNPQEKARLTARADAIERKLTIGDKNYPDWYVKAARNLTEGTSSAARLAELLSNPQVSRFSFQDRAALDQQIQGLKLAYATLKERGANFTESEQRMIEGLMGGNPLSWFSLPVRDRADYVEKLRTAHSAMVREWNTIEKTFATGKPNIAPFPKVGQQTTKSGIKYEVVP